MIKKIILGVNTNPNYFRLLPLVTKAYKRYFPDFMLIIALVGDLSKISGACRLYLQKHHFVIYPEVKGVSTGNQAKVVRLFEAARHPGDVCTVNDIDIIPLQREYFIHRYKLRRPNEILTIGKEWYNNTFAKGKFPMCWFTTEGHIFSQVMNPKNLSWEPWVKSLFDFPSVDGKEKINQPFNKFSDESLLLGMLKGYKGKVRHLKKYPFKKKPVCVISQSKPLNIEHLRKKKYIEAHHLMALNKNKDKLQDIGDYLYIDFKLNWDK